MFKNRADAGRQLADRLTEHGIETDIVLGIPRGALPAARPVADALDAPLDIVVAQKLGAPNNPELAIGTVTSDGSVWTNDDLVDRLGVSDGYIDRERERETESARQKIEEYRDGTAPDFDGKTVVIVDGGVATGATALACLRQVREGGAERTIFAVPIGSPDSLSRLEAEADEVIALQEPSNFRAVGQFYREFGQVADEEAMAYLDE